MHETFNFLGDKVHGGDLRMDITKRVANFVVQTEYNNLPLDVVKVAKAAFIDCLGVTLAGSSEQSATICAQIVRQEEAISEATVIGHGFKSSAAQAAFANGTAAHALDFDHTVYLGQPTSALIPALISVGESLGARGRDLLEAYVAGFEAATKIAKSIPRKGRGEWHSAGTVGTLGASLSCARLYRLDANKVRMALGIATSMASGIACNYGTMTKPLDVGLAARNGVVSAKLAQEGYTANPTALESEAGFYKAFLLLPPYAAPLEGLGQSYELTTGIKFKNYPCGGLTHPAIDAVLELRSSHGIVAQTVESIEVEVPKHTYKRIAIQIPQTGLEGKFCMGYIVARALMDGKVSLDAFTDSAVRERPILELARRVHMKPNADLDEISESRPCKVSVFLKDGQSFSRKVEHPRGSRQLPLFSQELRSKFAECARRSIDERSIEAALEYLEGLETAVDIRPLCQLLMGREK